MIYLLFACAFALSAAAAFYSIAGLMAIFATAPIPIAIMGSTLEVTKLVVASWLYHNWKEVPRLMKGYLTSALVVLMFLTSMGIFGFLSKAHLDQAVPTGDIAAKVSMLDERIKTEKENVNAARKTLNQLDQQVDQTISRTTDASGADRSVSVRRSQAREREGLLKQIEASQAKIAKLNEERAPIASELRKVEAEVGPIKYIAALVYGDNPEANVLESAVRWVTLMIVAVFDPLAVILLIAANWSLNHNKRSTPVTPNPLTTPTFPWKNEWYRGRLKRRPVVADPPEIKETVKEVIKEVVREAKERKAEPEPTPSKPAAQPQEHPVFKPDGGYWHSRPPTRK